MEEGIVYSRLTDVRAGGLSGYIPGHVYHRALLAEQDPCLKIRPVWLEFLS